MDLREFLVQIPLCALVEQDRQIDTDDTVAQIGPFDKFINPGEDFTPEPPKPDPARPPDNGARTPVF